LSRRSAVVASRAVMCGMALIVGCNPRAQTRRQTCPARRQWCSIPLLGSRGRTRRPDDHGHAHHRMPRRTEVSRSRQSSVDPHQAGASCRRRATDAIACLMSRHASGAPREPTETVQDEERWRVRATRRCMDVHRRLSCLSAGTHGRVTIAFNQRASSNPSEVPGKRSDAKGINYPKLTRTARWMYMTGWIPANAPERPAVDTGFIRR
jgi:hypothetical protein